MDLKVLLFSALICLAAVSVESNPRVTKLLGTIGKLGNLARNEIFGDSRGDKQKLLSALKGLRGRVLSGVFGGYNTIPMTYESAFSLTEANQIQQWTTKFPAVYGIDCAAGWNITPEKEEAMFIDCMNSQAVEYAKKGGIITVSHHLPNPVFAGNNANGEGAIKTAVTNSDYAAILQQGTPQRNRWWNMMEKIAEGLKGYKDQGVVVLYRPLHEMNGQWFWWGSLQEASQNDERQRLFKLLWQDLYNFMQNKGLDNLIWVYSPDHGLGSRTDFYPGDNYVDIVGLDAYTDDPTNINGYDEMIRLGKPFALAEVGPRTLNGQFDYDKFVKTIISKYPKTIYFMPWNAEWSPVKNLNPWAAYNNPMVINMGGLNWR